MMPADWALESVFHFTINASNFERSLAFYQALGFQLLRDNRDVVWPPEVAENFGMRRAQGRGALLALGIESVVCCRDPDGNLVELIEYMPGVLGSRIDHLPRRARSG